MKRLMKQRLMKQRSIQPLLCAVLLTVGVAQVHANTNANANVYNTSATQTQTQAQQQANRAKARRLNTKGYRLYKQGKYYQALPWFQRATQADSNYMLGQYNLACTASIVLNNFDCGQDESLLDMAHPDNIFSAQKTLELNPQRLAKIKTDPDLAMVRKSYRYYRDILGYSVHNNKQLKEILMNVDWTSDTLGWFLPDRLTFKADGTVILEQSSFTYRDENGQKVTVMYSSKIPDVAYANGGTINENRVHKIGKYQLANGVVTVEFDSETKGKQRVSGRINENGELNFAGENVFDILPSSEYRFHFPTPCEAP